MPIIRALGCAKRSPPSSSPSPPSPPPVLDEREGSRHGHPAGALDRGEGDKMKGVIKNKIKHFFLTYPPAWWLTPAPVRCLWPPHTFPISCLRRRRRARPPLWLLPVLVRNLNKIIRKMNTTREGTDILLTPASFCCPRPSPLPPSVVCADTNAIILVVHLFPT